MLELIRVSVHHSEQQQKIKERLNFGNELIPLNMSFEIGCSDLKKEMVANG